MKWLWQEQATRKKEEERKKERRKGRRLVSQRKGKNEIDLLIRISFFRSSGRLLEYSGIPILYSRAELDSTKFTQVKGLLRVVLGSFFSILQTHEGSHREVYQELQPSYDIFRRWCQGLFRPQVPCTPSLYCQPIANSASTQGQQPV